MTNPWHRAVCLGATLLVMGIAVGRGQPSEVGVIPVTDDDLPRELWGDRCVAHEMNIPVQELHLSGTELHLSGTRGGLAVGPIMYRDSPGTVADLALQRMTVAQALAAAGVPSMRPFLEDQMMQRDVVIIVADDFAGNVFELPGDLNGPSANSLTLQDIEDKIVARELSHGALVVHHLNVAIASLGTAREGNEPPEQQFRLESADTSVGRWVWVQQATDHKLIVRALDLSGVAGSPEITVQVVLDALETLVKGIVTEEFVGPDPGNVVVNMSWVFLPCKTIELFIQNAFKFKSFAEYLEGVNVDLNALPIEGVIARLAQVDDVELSEFLDSGRVQIAFQADRVVLVASAGNFSMTYQMLPAGWNAVVGVAVEDTGLPEPPRYSNVGDVTTPVESFVFEWLTSDGVRGGETDITYGGTSFTAPLVSLYAALDISSAMPFCTDKYSPPDLTHLGLTAGMLDVPLATAVDNCPHP